MGRLVAITPCVADETIAHWLPMLLSGRSIPTFAKVVDVAVDSANIIRLAHAPHSSLQPLRLEISHTKRRPDTV